MINSLLPIAILGTAKSAQPNFAQLDIVLADNLSVEEKILMAAAYEAIRENAAFEPEIIAENALPDCPLESKLYVSQQISDTLERILASANKDDAFVVQEAAEKIAERGWIIRPNVLLPLITFANQHTQTKNAILPILGERGKWLQSFYIKDTHKKEPTINWETGTLEERNLFWQAKYLHEPLEAIRLLQETWKTETVSQKKEFVRIIHLNPIKEVESFLDSVLVGMTEKDSELKRLIAETLVRIPNSSFVQRLETLLFQYVSYKARLLSGGKFELSFPSRFTDDWAKLGVNEKSKDYDKVEQGWVFQLLSLTPPELLEKHHTKTPEDWLKAAQKTNNFSGLMASIEKATILHQNKNWLKCILAHHLLEKTVNYYWMKPTMALTNTDFTETMQALALKFKGRQMSYILANRKTKWASIESNIACSEMKDAATRYAAKYPWECADLTALAETAAQFAHQDSLKEMINILYQLSQRSTQWLNSLDKIMQRMENRLTMSILVG